MFVLSERAGAVSFIVGMEEVGRPLTGNVMLADESYHDRLRIEYDTNHYLILHAFLGFLFPSRCLPLLSAAV